MKSKEWVRRLSGKTASYNFSAFSGIIIRLKDSESVLVQGFMPCGEKTVYTRPVLKPVEDFLNEDDEFEPGFMMPDWSEEPFFFSEFMRDNYMQEINSVLAGNY
jgi:hypothetical protein